MQSFIFMQLKGHQASNGEEEAMNLKQPTPKLSFLPLPIQSPETTGILTPPLQTAASVPFLWEDAPGKPRTWEFSSSINGSPTTPRGLDLPPFLGYGSFSRSSEEISAEKERAMAAFRKHESGRFLGLWWRRSLRAKGRIMDVVGCDDAKVKSGSRLKKSGSLSLASNHVWATITGSLKQMVPWKTRNLKKDKLYENVNHGFPILSSHQ